MHNINEQAIEKIEKSRLVSKKEKTILKVVAKENGIGIHYLRNGNIAFETIFSKNLIIIQGDELVVKGKTWTEGVYQNQEGADYVIVNIEKIAFM